MMLRIMKIISGQYISSDDNGKTLLEKNPDFTFRVEAPMYWWLDCDFDRFYIEFPKRNPKFCSDAWNYRTFDLTFPKDVTDRQLMQILPMSTIIEANITLSYKKIVEVCEEYRDGEYDYPIVNRWPTEREWTDFCESLLDLRGVRDIVEVNYEQ